MTRSRATRIAAAVLVAGLAFLWVAASRGADGADVVAVRLYPWPEGPGPVVAAPSPEVGLYVPLANIQSAIPAHLPWRLPSWPCAAGGRVQLTLRDGRMVTYGPCGVPASIEELRSTLAWEAQTHGTRVDH
jgi:hypothetical protein